MKIALYFLVLICTLQLSAQEKQYDFQRYQAIDYMLLFNPNSNKDNYYDANTGKMEDPSKFVLGGISGHYEYGIAYKKWLRLGVLTGIHANFFDSVYTIPLAPAVTLSPLIGDETRVYGKVAYGFNTAIGRGSLNGVFSHYHFGIEFGSGSRLFLFVNDHQFRIKGEVYRTAGIGFGGTLFKDNNN